MHELVTGPCNTQEVIRLKELDKDIISEYLEDVAPGDKVIIECQLSLCFYPYQNHANRTPKVYIIYLIYQRRAK